MARYDEALIKQRYRHIESLTYENYSIAYSIETNGTISISGALVTVILWNRMAVSSGHDLVDVNSRTSDIWIRSTQGIEQISDIIPWLDSIFVDRIPVL